MPRERHIDPDVGPSFHMNHLATVLWGLPSLWRQVLAVRIGGLDVDVFRRWTNVGEAPCDALVVSNDHVRHTRQGDAVCVEVAAVKMSFIPQVGHLVPE